MKSAMKKILCLLLLCALGLPLAACAPAEGAGEPSQSESVSENASESTSESTSESESQASVPQGAAVLADGRGAYGVVVCEEEEGLLLRSAELLSQAAAAVTGHALPVLPQEEEGKLALCLKVEKGREGYAFLWEEDGSLTLVASSEEALYLAAEAVAEGWCARMEERGVLYATQALCEELSLLPTRYEGALRVMTQNLRCADDGVGKTVAERAVRFGALVADYRPDIIGTQETTAKWNGLLEEMLGEEYALVGEGRDASAGAWNEWCTVLYRKDRFTLLDSGTFWLSDTPEVPSSVAEGILNRICTWVVLEDLRTGERIVFANTHLDHTQDEQYRLAQVAVLCDFLETVMGEGALYLTGDFNATMDSDTYWEVRGLLDDVFYEALLDRSEVDYTYHNYGQVEKCIDFCFYDYEESFALSVEILADQYDGYVSDHYAVLAVFVPESE